MIVAKPASKAAVLLARRASLSRPISPIAFPTLFAPTSSDLTSKLLRTPQLVSRVSYCTGYPAAAAAKQGEKIGSKQLGEEAGATGLEPAASGVTSRRSNQLNYAPAQSTVSVPN